MSKDDKINLKLEVFKDKNSGKLTLMAHFDKSAPNIYKDKENILWLPTDGEKEFLFEAFELLPEGPASPTLKNTNSKTETPVDTDDTNEQEPAEVIEELTEEQSSTKDITPNEDITDERVEKQTVSSASSSEKETDDTTSTDTKDTQPDIDDAMLEEIDNDEVNNLENEKDKAMIVEADADAIDEAIKKHTKSDDESIVEADEQTIIDKVLSQKKKGRWSRK